MTKFFQEKIRVEYTPEKPLWKYTANRVSYIFWGKVPWGSEMIWGYGFSKAEAIADLRQRLRLIEQRKTEVVDF